jgi:demethylmenaquinone methyltransferase/2-methoxy-6-polyprenyl-1,4-benzoquinol methylase
MLRVLKPNGMAVILEFSRPTVFPIKNLYAFYFKQVCPLVGKVFSKDNRAYTYLNESVAAFPDGNDFLKIMEKTGFRNCQKHALTFGIATIYSGEK